MSEPNITDDELENLMAELEAQNAEIAAAQQAATVREEPPHDPNPAADDAKPETASAEEPVVAEVETVAACEDEAGSGETEFGEADLAELEAELEAAHSAGHADLPVEAVEALTKNGTAIDQEATVPLVKDEATGKLSTPGSAALSDAALTEPSVTHAAPSEPVVSERRVVLNEDGSVKQPAMSFGREEPRRPTEATGPGSLQHYVDVDQFRDDTRVTEINLDKCMIEQSGLRAYYGATAARAEAQAARVKAKFEVVEATLYDHHRKELAKMGEKTTEKMVENAVKVDPRWLKAKNMVIEADTIATINKSLVESLKDRRDMIIQLGADRRDEYKGAARVLAEQGQRDDLRDRAMRAIQGNKAA